MFNYQIEKQKFIDFMINTIGDDCYYLYPKKDEYPMDEEAKSKITFYSSLLFDRGLWRGIDDDEYAQENRDLAHTIYETWIKGSIGQSVDNVLEALNDVIADRVAEKMKMPIYFTPNFLGRKSLVEERIVQISSKEIEEEKKNVKI